MVRGPVAGGKGKPRGRNEGQRPWKPKGAGRKRKDRWEDPDTDDEAEDAEEKVEREHEKWAQHGDVDADDDDAEEDLRGSDSEEESCGEGQAARFLKQFARRKRPSAASEARSKETEEVQTDEGGLWDPLADVGPRRKRRLVNFLPQGEPEGRQLDAPGSELPEGTRVCLVGLQKAPQLNGQVGTVAGPVDGATGRCPILLEDGSVKSLRRENLHEVLTGAVVRLKGLKAAPELNGRIAECGNLDLAAGRYTVVLADGKETQKKVKEENVELARRYVSIGQMLSAQRRPFTWKAAVESQVSGSETAGSGRAWSVQLSNLKDLGLPAPRLLPCEALSSVAKIEDKDVANCCGSLESAAVLADKAPVDSEGQLSCRVFLVSYERDACSPMAAPRVEVLRRIGLAAQDVLKLVQEPSFFLLPWLCVKPLPCLHAAATCAWPLYVALCQAVMCVDTQHRLAKSWGRFELLQSWTMMSKPVYFYPCSGQVHARQPGAKDHEGGGDGSQWLLSDKATFLDVGAPADGQVLPAERALLESMATDVLKTGWRKSGKVTAYEL